MVDDVGVTGIRPIDDNPSRQRKRQDAKQEEKPLKRKAERKKKVPREEKEGGIDIVI